ncbi:MULTISPECIES: hypothetical protein [Rhodomicrobium]|nr:MULTISPECIES: hypothetical protein [Rhodomicrobium]
MPLDGELIIQLDRVRARARASFKHLSYLRRLTTQMAAFPSERAF